MCSSDLSTMTQLRLSLWSRPLNPYSVNYTLEPLTAPCLSLMTTSTSSTPSHLRSLGRSESAPASVHQAPTSGQSPSQPGFPGVPGSLSHVQATAPTAPKASPPATTNPTLHPPPTPSALDLLSTPSPNPADKAATGTPPPTDAEDRKSTRLNSSH